MAAPIGIALGAVAGVTMVVVKGRADVEERMAREPFSVVLTAKKRSAPKRRRRKPRRSSKQS